jgi:hypothetical protein
MSSSNIIEDEDINYNKDSGDIINARTLGVKKNKLKLKEVSYSEIPLGQLSKPKVTKIPDSVKNNANARELLPPEQRDDPNFIVSDSEINKAMQRELNKKDYDKWLANQKAWQADQLRKMQLLEQRKREEEEVKRQERKQLPQQQFAAFLAGKRSKCPSCNTSQYYWKSCKTNKCGAVLVSVEPLMSKLYERLQQLQQQLNVKMKKV